MVLLAVQFTGARRKKTRKKRGHATWYTRSRTPLSELGTRNKKNAGHETGEQRIKTAQVGTTETAEVNEKV